MEMTLLFQRRGLFRGCERHNGVPSSALNVRRRTLHLRRRNAVPEDLASAALDNQDLFKEASSPVDSLVSAAEDLPELGAWDAVSDNGDLLSSIEVAALSSGEPEEEENPYTEADAGVSRPRAPQPSEADIGSSALESLLLDADEGHPVTLERLEGIFPFPLDAFQKKAVAALLEGKSVVVCAPTGAGKTAIAEAAAAATLSKGQRVIYTTPLKALSNQKLQETRARFGAARCGLQTGDMSLNPDGSIVVMTTEILRNIMYRTAETTGPSSGATRDERLGDVGLVVLDEVHYLGDPSRGSVWEEVIINCPRHIKLLAMSATVKNPDDLGGWIGQEHGECVTVRTRFRPVPLRWMFCYAAGGPRGPGTMTDLLDSGGRALNPKLSMDKFIKAEARRVLAQGRAASSPQDVAAQEKSFERQLRKDALRKRVMMKMVPNAEQVITCLKSSDMLPAIWFILSRQGCDQAALAAGLDVSLTTVDEQAQIMAEIRELSADQPEGVRTKFVPALMRGVAAHHAGCLPGWKALVERCFQKGLVKLVFATGTLAAGINMPARTTIISSLARRTDDGIQLLPHNELLQMAGRAGRRGYDTRGNCVILPTRFEGADAGQRIIAAGPEPLISQFTTSYGMVLNLLSCYSLDEAKEFLSKSFGQYMSGAGNARRRKEVQELEAEAAALMAAAKGSPSPQPSGSAPSKALRKEREKLSRLNTRARDQRCALVAAATAGSQLPTLLLLNLARKDSEKPQLLPAMVIGVVDSEDDTPMALYQKQTGGNNGVSGGEEGEGESEDAASSGGLPASLKGLQKPLLFCLGADNRLMVVSASHVVGTCSDDALVTELTQQYAATWAALAPGWRAAVEDVRAWKNHAAGMFSCQVAVGGSRTQGVALALNQPHDAFQPLPIDEGLLAEIADQRAAVQAASQQLAAARKVTKAAGVSGGVAAAGGGNPKEGKLRAARLLRKAARIKEEMGMAMETTWNGFLQVMDILMAMGALEEETMAIQPLGLLARSLQGQNELWMAIALSHPAVMGLTGPQLAAYIGALICSEVIRRPMSVWSPYQVSMEVLSAIEALEPSREALFEAQTAAGIVRWNEFLLVDLRFAGIVEAWAAGASWSDIMADVDLDDGDMARLLARTVDILRQVLFLEHLLPYLMGPAREALRGMDRKPISDLTL